MTQLMGFAVSVITSAAVSALLAAVLVWFARSWITERLKNAIKSEYDQKLETHKAQLKAQSDVEIERLRAQLSISATEHEVRFSRLHEKRAEVIAETYSLLKELFYRLGDYVKIFEPAGDSPREQRRQAAVDAHRAFRTYYTGRLVFIPKATATKLEAIDFQLVKTFNEFVFGVDMASNTSTNTMDKWTKIFERVSGEIKNALSELEEEFRQLLGDKS